MANDIYSKTCKSDSTTLCAMLSSDERGNVLQSARLLLLIISKWALWSDKVNIQREMQPLLFQTQPIFFLCISENAYLVITKNC